MNIVLSFFLLAAPQEPTSIIQYRPEAPRNLTSYDQQTRQQMADADKEIAKLLSDRESLAKRLQDASVRARALLEQYHAELEEEQLVSSQMRSVDDRISELARQKAKLADQLKK